MKWAVVLLLFSNVSENFAKIKIFPGETYEDCSDGGQARHIVLSKLEHDYLNDTEYVLTGKIAFPGGMKSPVKYEVFVEKFDRGKWHLAVLNRRGDDFCAVIQSPAEPWYALFSKFKKKDCPFEPGYEETYDNEKVATSPDLIPYTLIGKYRFTMKFTFADDDGPFTDCSRTLVEIFDV